MRKLLVLVAIAAGIVGYRKLKEASAHKAGWSHGTDKVV
ncbi:DLW-39 family protein [Paeniglutamicibacter sp. R2-26]